MKKIALFICMACVALGMSAQSITSRSRIYLKSAGETDKEVRLLVSSSFSNAWDQTWDATPAQDGGIYVYYQNAKYSIWASNEYSTNLALAFDANDNETYRLSFSSFTGQSYTITDLGNNNHEILVNGSTEDYEFSIDQEERNTSILNRFIINYDPALATVTTNAYGLATFSFDQDLVAVEADAKLYKGKVEGGDFVLTLVDYVKAGEGVIVYNEAAEVTTYHFVAGTGTSDFDDNDLKAASTWAYPHAGFNAYVLSGSSLYLYEGENMKPNKAFLLLASAGAPKRIAFRFEEEQGVENIAAEGKAVKFIENGRVFIKRGEKVYNLQGQLVK